jgi:cellulose synthase operon protein C
MRPHPPFLAAPSVMVMMMLLVSGCDRPTPDQELYRRAHDAGITRRPNEAKELYRRLIKEHPGSRFSPDAHLALAEMLFNQGDFDAAALEYAQVLAFPEAMTWGYALYKQGWCHMNQNQPRRAMEVFERVIALEHEDRIPAERRRPLVHEARRDLVKAYALLAPAADPADAGAPGGPDRAAEYFGKWGGAVTPQLLDLLAERYFEQELLPASQAIYRDLIANHLDSPRLCSWQNSLVRIAMLSGSHKEQVAEVQRLGAVLSRVEGQTSLPAADREACRTHLRDTLKELTLASHKKGQKEHALGLYELADPLYRQYLTRFRDEKDAYAMTFYHAEVLWTLGRWEEAAQEYRRVVQLDPKGKFLPEAAYAYVLATKNALKLDDAAPPRAGAGDKGAALPLSPAQQQMMAAFDFYIQHVPAGYALLKIEYRRARTHYDHGDHEAAARRFRELVDRHGAEDDELVAFAINAELDSLQALGRSDEMCARARALQEGPTAKRDAELRTTLQALVTACKRP